LFEEEYISGEDVLILSLKEIWDQGNLRPREFEAKGTTTREFLPREFSQGIQPRELPLRDKLYGLESWSKRGSRLVDRATVPWVSHLNIRG
jgi:hypothetical protein